MPSLIPDEALDTSTPVLVLKMHHGSLGIARSLGRLGVPVYGLCHASQEPAGLSRYWRECYPWDIESAPEPKSIEFLLALGKKLGRRAILIPVSDRTAQFVADHTGTLEQCYIFPDVSSELVRRLTSKKQMHAIANAIGIPTAKTYFPRSRAEVLQFTDRAVFPLMLKADDGVRLFARTGSKMAIVRTPAELLEQYDRWEDADSPNLMLQEYIAGGDETLWMFNGYFNDASECLAGFTGIKIRQTPPSMGSTSLGLCLPNPEVDQLTRRFMKAIGYQGILDIGYRYDVRDHRYKVLDVNPRIGSTFRLFVDKNGLDVVRALYRDLTAQGVPKPVSADGRKWCVEDMDFETFRLTRRTGHLSLGEWLATLRGVDEGAWFARDDLRPFLSIAQTHFRYFLRAGIRKLRPCLALLRTHRAAP